MRDVIYRQYDKYVSVYLKNRYKTNVSDTYEPTREINTFELHRMVFTFPIIDTNKKINGRLQYI